MEMRHQPRLAGDQLEQSAVNLDAVERGQARALRPRLGGEQALAEVSEPAGIVRNVHAGEDDLLRAPVDLARDGAANGFEWQRHAWSARLPDGAEGAAVVASGLHRDEAFHAVQ